MKYTQQDADNLKEVMFHLRHSCDGVCGKDKMLKVVTIIKDKTNLTEEAVLNALEVIGEGVEYFDKPLELVK